MRSLVVTSLVLSLAAGLAGCGKSPGQGQSEGAQATSSAQPSNAQSVQKAEPTLDEMKAAQAGLPAPYNAADLANGKTKFAFCVSCHTIAPGGPNMTGPHLSGVAGRKAGSLPDFNYSEALKTSGLTWDGPTLEKWLTDPRGMIPGTKMSFVGIKNPKDRTDVVAYLLAASAAQK